MCYLDDLITAAKTVFEHFIALQLVMERLRIRGLKLKPSKCLFFRNSIDILGRVATGDTIQMSQKDIEVIANWPAPKTFKQLESWLGLANYHRAYLKNFAEYARPLYLLLKDKKRTLPWTDENEEAFQALKKGLM